MTKQFQIIVLKYFTLIIDKMYFGDKNEKWWDELKHEITAWINDARKEKP